MAPVNDLTRFICLFHHPDRAHAAVRALENLDLAAGAVRTVADGEAETGMAGSQMLTDLGVPERDLKHLQDGIRHGGVLVTVEGREGLSGEIERIFHQYSAGKIDETEAGGAREFAAAPVEGDLAAGETVIPIAEETLQVGKREVDRGGVRVFRHTVEEPVSESVNLHEEHVVVDRRPVDRAVTDADLRAGTQQIELVETAEVPVVEKVSRVVEEVRVGKVETDRTETVQDTVRHTEVDVQPIEQTGGTRDRTEFNR